MKDIITVAVVNFRVDAANKESNLSRMCGFTEAAAKRGADLILFPELCLYGYDYYVDESVSQEEKIATAETINGLRYGREERGRRRCRFIQFGSGYRSGRSHRSLPEDASV